MYHDIALETFVGCRLKRYNIKTLLMLFMKRMNMDNDDFSIVVEFDEPGFVDTGISDQLKDVSLKAIKNSMKSIIWVAEQAELSIDSLDKKPSQAEVEFGIKIGTETGKLVMKVGAEAHIKVKLVWKYNQS